MAFFQYAERCYTKMRKFENILDYLSRTAAIAARVRAGAAGATPVTLVVPVLSGDAAISVARQLGVSNGNAVSSAPSAAEEIVDDLRNIHLETDGQS